LDIRRHLESNKKLFFHEICPTKIHDHAQTKKSERKHVQNSLSYGGKTILKITAILKTCEKNCPFLLATYGI
jgi:hypothetical protein